MKNFILSFILLILNVNLIFSQSVDVTFMVDMQYQTVSNDGVHIAGSMQGWNPSSTPLSDADGDNVWEVTITLNANSYYEYKFINGNNWGSDEILQWWESCSNGSGNRILNTSSNDETLPPYLFGSCQVLVFYGCTDPTASNYNSSATNDDGSCTFSSVSGCTDSLACNYNSLADTDDGSCNYSNTGSSIVTECDDYYWEGIVYTVSGIYTQVFSNADGCDSVHTLDLTIENSGCQDPSANNYDANACSDDGSCTYTVSVEFHVDMNNEVVSSSGVHLAGTFTSWNSDSIEMLDLDGDGIYTVSVNLNQGWYYEYKYLNGDSWGTDEVLASWESCSNGSGNRVLNTDTSLTQILSVVCFSSCATCPIYGCTDSTATNYNSSATNDDGSCTFPSVSGCTDSLACNYNSLADTDDGSCNYSNTGSSIVTECDDYYWEGIVLYTVSGIYTQVFSNVDGCDSVHTLDLTIENSGCQDPSANNYDANACSDDGSCTYTVSVEFHVDMNNEVVSSSGVHLAGTFTSWSSDSIEMLDLDGDGIYTVSVNLNQGWYYEYKYLNGDSWGADEVLASWESCSNGSGNRVLNTDTSLTQILSVVCFSSCATCQIYGCTDSTACNYDATATVDDGSCATSLLVTTTVCTSATEVRMTGPWWNWDPNGGPIAVDNGNGTWTFTFCPAPTADMEYLLVVDGVQENLINAPHPDLDGDGYGDLWDCSPITDYWSYANRLWVVGSGDVANTYGTCGSCGDVYGCTDSTATNYDPNANVGDASCTYCVYGCTDATQFNYDANATCDDGSCIPYTYGCTDPAAANYNSSVNTDDGSCIYFGCTVALQLLTTQIV